MKFVADLHLHSKYSRAVSEQMNLSNMSVWGKMKGINVLATSDFTHPFWFEQLKNELEDTGKGLYQLKTINSKQETEVYFLLSCEISSIYSQDGKSHRIHNLVLFPSLKSVEKFNGELRNRKVNVRSDGRPIVGISSRDLLEIALSADEKVLFIPAHIWTPWFSLFGSMSGFDSLEECFGDLADKIYAVETGLSSDPAMNWRVGNLDSRAIVSSSDAHSLEKIGREATVFEAEEVSYDSIYHAIVGISGRQVVRSSGNKKPDSPNTRIPDNPGSKIAFTIEFYPEEGKYHYTGHRDCDFSQSPEETKKNGDRCPVCSRPLTVGVMHRVEDLATREEDVERIDKNGVRWVKSKADRPPYVSLVPLAEIIAEVENSAIKTKKVFDQYQTLVNNLGSEFNVLLKADISEISKYAYPKVAEGIDKVRRGDIKIDPGYDGKFGEVKIWSTDSKTQAKESEVSDESQLNLFA